jgi:Ca-activated chloride channel homolog
MWAQTAPFRSRIDIVQVTVSVADANGRLITGLTQGDFQVFEDGVEQTITQFTDQRVPVSLGMLLDASDSMRGQPVVDARDAFDRFVGELLLTEDEVFVATFNHLPRLVTKWTMPPTVLRGRLNDLKPSGGTAIYDALADTSRLFEQRTNLRAAMIVVSDGADTASDRSLLQTIEVIRRNDAFVYAIAIDPPGERESTRVNPDALRDITGLTGGYTEVVRSAADLGPATARIADELNKQYTLGYSSSKPPDGTWRPLRVRVRSGAYFVRARRGYFAPPARQPTR